MAWRRNWKKQEAECSLSRTMRIPWMWLFLAKWKPEKVTWVTSWWGTRSENCLQKPAMIAWNSQRSRYMTRVPARPRTSWKKSQRKTTHPEDSGSITGKQPVWSSYFIWELWRGLIPLGLAAWPRRIKNWPESMLKTRILSSLHLILTRQERNRTFRRWKSCMTWESVSFWCWHNLIYWKKIVMMRVTSFKIQHQSRTMTAVLPRITWRKRWKNMESSWEMKIS